PCWEQQGADAPRSPDDLAFERKLYVIRRRIENLLKPSPFGPDSSEEFFTRWEADMQREVAAMHAGHRAMFYVPSLSYKTLIYKGMLNADQLPQFFPDLNDPSLVSALAMVHSRFSTNTFPTWARSHPYRYISHNGEINTLRGNVNWMTARERMFSSPLFGDDIKKILPVIDQSGSDSAMFDNALELLVLAGRSLPHAVMMMIPEPWSGDEWMSAEKKAFYEYHASLMEPWDGPASIAFTDGVRIGAVLDRNGLRPSRYYVTKDDRVIMASEVGVLDVPPEMVLHKGRLQPGRMFLVDMEQGRIIADDELKKQIATEHHYDEWLRDNLVTLEQLPPGPRVHEPDHDTVRLRQRVFGYTTEDLKILMAPMAEQGNEAIGSMGNDAALAVLSDRPQLLYNYFKQLFAQVTNPPVDGIREELIMAMETTIGAEYNLLQPTPRSARQIKLQSPILKNDELDKLRQLDGKGPGHFKSVTLPILFPV
ncbi:MAG: glutamate synthase central domain-containing protein, partial [Gemmataceae bacterium]